MIFDKVFLIRVVTFIGLPVLVFLFLRDSRSNSIRSYNVKLANYDIIQLHVFSSCRRVYGTRALTFGGGGCRKGVYFSYNNKIYKWEGEHYLLLINIYQNNIYLACWDPQNLKNGFKFYQLSDKSKEIKKDEFPKAIAYQNIALSNENDDDLWDFRNLNVDSRYFRRSLTAKLWFYLGFRDLYDCENYKFLKILKKFKDCYMKNGAVIISEQESKSPNKGVEFKKPSVIFRFQIVHLVKMLITVIAIAGIAVMFARHRLAYLYPSDNKMLNIFFSLLIVLGLVVVTSVFFLAFGVLIF